MFEMTLRSNLQKKLYLVYFLNVIDWICTVALLTTGRFYEANPIARTFIGSYSAGFFIKCIIPFAAVFFICRAMSILGVREMKIADMLISFGLVLYIAVNIDHLINFLLLVFY